MSPMSLLGDGWNWFVSEPNFCLVLLSKTLLPPANKAAIRWYLQSCRSVIVSVHIGFICDHYPLCIEPQNTWPLPGHIQTFSTWTSLYRESPDMLNWLGQYEERGVGKRAVHILLECYLVLFCFTLLLFLVTGTRVCYSKTRRKWTGRSH